MNSPVWKQELFSVAPGLIRRMDLHFVLPMYISVVIPNHWRAASLQVLIRAGQQIAVQVTGSL